MPVFKASLPQANIDQAANFQFVKDINTSANSSPGNYSFSYTSNFAVLNNVIYFQADDGINGTELWRSDGTDTGTYMVKNIAAGNASSYPWYIIVYKNKIYFAADDGIIGSELYQSDGTTAGTVLLKDIRPGEPSSHPTNFTIMNGSLYFTTSEGLQNELLWKTDGTTANTILVVNLNTSFSVDIVGQLRAINNLLFFTASRFLNGAELWRSDGTAAGTFMVKDINPNNNYNYYDFDGPANLTAHKNKLYFSANDGHNRVLWVSDGTNTGTTAVPYNNDVTLFTTGYNIYQDNPFATAGNTIYFAGSTSSTGTELYKYNINGTSGAVLVKNITHGSTSSPLTNEIIRSMNDTIYFVMFDIIDSTYKLWKSGGKKVSTNVISVLPGYVSPYGFFVSNQKLYFNTISDVEGSEPWVSDGSSIGTKLLKDINAGGGNSNPELFTFCNNRTFFTASTLTNGIELWSTKGTKASTKLVKDINTTATASSTSLGRAIAYDSSTIFFEANSAANGYEPWKSDGTGTGTKIIKDIVAGDYGSNPVLIAIKNKKVFFFTHDDHPVNYGNNTKQGIYTTDGTAANTKKIGTSANYIYDMKVTDNGIAFYTTPNDSSGKKELWRTDSSGNNFKISDNIGYDIGVAGNLCFFSAFNEFGYELWKTDGTVNGTAFVKDISPGSNDSNPFDFVTRGNKVIFSARDQTFNYYLWVSDGTNSGTLLLKTISPELWDVCISKGKLYFRAFDPSTGNELYKTDGTPAGTILVKDINVGSQGSYPLNITDVNGTVYFRADDGLHGSELWKTNGNESGTKMVKDITPGIEGTNLNNFTSAANKLYCTNNEVLWSSDGTGKGTKQISDVGLNDIYIGALYGNGNKLFLSGYTYKYGFELYEGDVTLAAPQFSRIATTNAAAALIHDASLFPNPATSTSTLRLNENWKDAKLILTDLTGKILWKMDKITDKTINIPISNLPKGAYMVIIKDNEHSKTFKLIKE